MICYNFLMFCRSFIGVISSQYLFLIFHHLTRLPYTPYIWFRFRMFRFRIKVKDAPLPKLLKKYLGIRQIKVMDSWTREYYRLWCGLYYWIYSVAFFTCLLLTVIRNLWSLALLGAIYYHRFTTLSVHLMCCVFSWRFFQPRYGFSLELAIHAAYNWPKIPRFCFVASVQAITSGWLRIPS